MLALVQSVLNSQNGVFFVSTETGNVCHIYYNHRQHNPAPSHLSYCKAHRSENQNVGRSRSRNSLTLLKGNNDGSLRTHLERCFLLHSTCTELLFSCLTWGNRKVTFNKLKNKVWDERVIASAMKATLPEHQINTWTTVRSGTQNEMLPAKGARSSWKMKWETSRRDVFGSNAWKPLNERSKQYWQIRERKWVPGSDSLNNAFSVSHRDCLPLRLKHQFQEIIRSPRIPLLWLSSAL